jgi:hypothetical protein
MQQLERYVEAEVQLIGFQYAGRSLEKKKIVINTKTKIIKVAKKNTNQLLSRVNSRLQLAGKLPLQASSKLNY